MLTYLFGSRNEPSWFVLQNLPTATDDDRHEEKDGKTK